MPDREYIVSSVYRIRGTATILASSAAEAIEKGLNAHELGIEFEFSEPYGETKMQAFLPNTPRAIL